MGTISIKDRVTAAVEAADLRSLLRRDEDGTSHHDDACAHVFTIICQIKKCDPDMRAIRSAIQSLMTVEPHAPWRKAWIRLYLGEIERALGLEHSADTAAALKAFHLNETWMEFSIRIAAKRTEAA
jgi:hypothetical protein